MEHYSFVKMKKSTLLESDPSYAQDTDWISDYMMIFDIDYCLYGDPTGKIRELESSHRLKGCGGKDVNFKALKSNYKSTRKGLFEEEKMSLKQIKDMEFTSIDEYLIPDIELRKKLEAIPCRKFCFSNGYEQKANRILRKLGISGFIDLVFIPDDEDTVHWIQKPFEDAFQIVQKYIPSNIKVYFFDDQVENLKVAQENFGWIPIQISEKYTINDALAEFKPGFELEE
ncbi:hypothetical protein GINT2_001629 [Glugoides intestinalis]